MRIKPVRSVAEIILDNKFILEQMKRDFSKKKKVVTYEKITIEQTPNKVDVKA